MMKFSKHSDIASWDFINTKNIHITSYTIYHIHILQDIDKTLHIKGQMVYIEEWQQMLFLACPIMKDLNHLIWSGLFVNDLR